MATIPIMRRIWRPSARRWYLGSLVGLAWLAFPVFAIWRSGNPVAVNLVGQILLVVWAALYVLVPPLLWDEPTARKVWFSAAFFATSLLFIPFMGVTITSLWVFVCIALAMSVVPMMVLAAFSGAVSLLVLTVSASTADLSTAFYFPLIIFSISMMMGAFARQIDLVQQLRSSQQETSRLAVEQERSRVARDIHDILGHSLTVITVKAELAGRLLETHPHAADRAGDHRAAREVADIERLARDALADVRATVTGYRGVNLAAELSGARAALNSAGIQADLPNSVDSVSSEGRELFAWVVREGVTNVIRHSGAARCQIVLAEHSIVVMDDGTGVPAPLTVSGNGLNGLRERADLAGATLDVGRAPSGGFQLAVSL